MGTLLFFLWANLVICVSQAAVVQSGVTGTFNGYPLDLSQATVSFDVLGGNNAATIVHAEIYPNSVPANIKSKVFIYDLLPSIGVNDTGINRITIVSPSGYKNISLNWLSIAGDLWSQTCPAVSANTFCAISDGTKLTIDLGIKVMVDKSRISAEIQADTPLEAGVGLFFSYVDDVNTPDISSMESVDGSADGDVTDNNSRQVAVVTSADPLLSTIVVVPDIVIADGISNSQVTVTLLDSNGSPVTDKKIALSTNRGVFDNIEQPIGITLTNGSAIGKIYSNKPGISTVSATNINDGFDLLSRPLIYFSQGEILRLTKRANKEKAMIGDLVTYYVEIKNSTDKTIEQVSLLDRIPPNFKYLPGSSRINGIQTQDPSGIHQLNFLIGNIDALSDKNGNGQADAGESGYQMLSYQLIIGSGAKPGDYINNAYAIDVCNRCLISNRVESKVEVVIDPIFDLGTIIGKVFGDHDGDGHQSKGEIGIGGAMVVLDNGSYVLTDEYGRYHFSAVAPGHRLLKINLPHLADNAVVTTEEALIVSVTPGLLAKANFGVRYIFEKNSIGRDLVKGVTMEGDSSQKPIQIQGYAEVMLAVINGTVKHLSNSNVNLNSLNMDNTIKIKGGELETPAIFNVQIDDNDRVESWSFVINDSDGKHVYTLSGRGPLPSILEWNGRDDSGKTVKGGKIFQYQLLINYSDGVSIKTSRQLFGVNRTEVLSVNMSGGAFKTGSTELSDDAKKILSGAAKVLKQFPGEQVLVEGHSDNRGDDNVNMILSQRRAEAAAHFLVDIEGVPREQLIIRWFGESSPIVSNNTDMGREINRRVEIKGDFSTESDVKLYDQYRTMPQVKINGELLPLDGLGRFQRSYSYEETSQLTMEMVSSSGSEFKAIVNIPSLVFYTMKGKETLPYPEIYNDVGIVGTNSESQHGFLMPYELRGRTDPGNSLEIDGIGVSITDDGVFNHSLMLHSGKNSVSVIVTNAQGYSRIADLQATLSDRNVDGKLMLLVDPIPSLTVKLPQMGVLRTVPELPVSGVTNPLNKITINGERITVDPNGHFVANLVLPKGENSVRVEVTDPEGYSGVIERNIEISDDRMFFMAFADGKFGQLKGSGYLEASGLQKSNSFYSEGRVAYYLKGVIKGKYLITSSFDTGDNDSFMNNIDKQESSRLFTNLDPDKYYPVYGDSSTLVDEINSQGKFYLALTSDEMSVFVGNYAIGFDKTELASYQRTLYGIRGIYTSIAKNINERPNAQAIIFAAEVKQVPIHDELNGTGGSLYYLSHGDIIEGSEQVSIVVRDRDTGLILSRKTLQRNIDYRIYYDQGRLITSDPIASVVDSHSLFDSSLLSGNPTILTVDYETNLSSFDKKSYGVRASKALGKNVAVGITQINDEINNGEYQLTGIDAEIDIGRGLRIVTELAQSRGIASHTYYSQDGGLSFDDLTPAGTLEGQAWKAAMELDIGKLLNDPGRMLINGYAKQLGEGFLSSGNFLEKGTRKIGITMLYTLSNQSKLLASSSMEESSITTINPNSIVETKKLSLQWRYDAKDWGVSTEYQNRDAVNSVGDSVSSGDYISGQLRYKVNDSLDTQIEQQQTLSGDEDDQTTIGADYKIGQSTELIGRLANGTQGTAAKVGVQWLFDGGRIYLDERMRQNTLGQSSLSTVIGGENQLAKNSRIYSEYQIENSTAGDRQVSMVGIDRFWDIQQGFRLKLAVEKGVINGALNDSERYTLSTRLSYKGVSGLSGSTKNEIRRESGDKERIQYLSNTLLELKINPDYTFIFKYLISQTKDLNLGVTESELNEHSIGFAYRPVESDRFNMLARYTGIYDKRPLTLHVQDDQESQVEILSSEWSYELTPNIEWVDKLAYKRKSQNDNEQSPFTSHTWLSIHRLNYQFITDWDLGMEYRSLSQREAKDQRDGWLTELMWRANRHVRLGVGFNFTDFSDNERSDNDYSVYGWFLRLQGKY